MSIGVWLSIDDKDACLSGVQEVAAYSSRRNSTLIALQGSTCRDVFASCSWHPLEEKNGKYIRLGVARIVGDTAIKFMKE